MVGTNARDRGRLVSSASSLSSNVTTRPEPLSSPRALAQLSHGVLFSLLAVAWLHGFFLHPLAQEASEMHQRQLDPTQIVNIPYDLNRLFLFVSCTVFVCVLSHPHDHLKPSSSSPSSPPLLRYLSRISLDALVMTFLMILCGASPSRDVGHTVCAALYLVAVATATTTTSPLPRMLMTTAPPKRGSAQHNEVDIEEDSTPMVHMLLLQRLSYASSSVPADLFAGTKSDPSRRNRRSLDHHRLLSLFPCLLAVGFNVPFSVLRLYDRGWQWQRWPVPIIVATTYGWAVGNLAETILRVRLPRRSV